MANQNPEQIARDNIDKQLIACGWIIQGIKQVNLNAGIGVAVNAKLKHLKNEPLPFFQNNQRNFRCRTNQRG